MTSRRITPISFVWLVPAMAAVFALAAGPASAQPNVVGQWSSVYAWPDVAIHLHLLPDGRIVSFSDDDNPNYLINGSRLAGSTKAYVVEIPQGGAPGTVTPVPNDRTNMFCAGHGHLADGRLFVVGGHRGKDGWGEERTQFIDYHDPTSWIPGPDMYQGRWYPSACVLPSGDLLAISGTREEAVLQADIPEIWSVTSGTWRQLTGAQRTLPYYPFTFVAPDGRVFVAGPQRDTRFLTVTGLGSWSAGINHILNVNRQYGSAVQYGDGLIMVSGGADPPTSTCEIIDLNSGTPAWASTGAMGFARRQHNTTILPDGTVLATGGSSASGFNNAAGAVLTAELWTPPPDGGWDPMASMANHRLYHSSALLLPDGRVLSAGGGRPKATNGGLDQWNAEIYSPPYLFKGARPTITSAPAVVGNGETFDITTPDAASVAQVTLLRLGTVTHAFNQGQRFNRLTFTTGAGVLHATVPSSGALVPPGFYMLFVLNGTGVPSVARMIQVIPTSLVGVEPQTAEGLLDFLSLRSANPMRQGRAHIAFSLSRSETGRLEVLDVTGRRVKLLADRYFGAGLEQVVTWDGTDEAGQRVKSGLYWYRLSTPSLTRTGKLTLLSN